MSDVKRYSESCMEGGGVAPDSNGDLVEWKDYDALAADNQRLREALEFACKSLAQVTSSDGSGHADIALSCLRMAGVDADERERIVDGWTAKCQWRIHAALAGSKEGDRAEG